MSTPEPLAAPGESWVVLPIVVWGSSGGQKSTVKVTKLPNGQLRFDPRIPGACVFTVEEDELLRALVRL